MCGKHAALKLENQLCSPLYDATKEVGEYLYPDSDTLTPLIKRLEEKSACENAIFRNP